MFEIFGLLTAPFEWFARAGGGGSSSGGGGGGGGIAVIMAIGYVPMHFFGALIRRKLENGQFWVVAQIGGWLLCVFSCFWLIFLGTFGGMIALGALVGMGAGLYNWFSKLKRSKRVTKELRHAALQDPTWNEEAIVARTKELFMMYQADWSARSWERMSQYMTPHYYQHASLMVAALLQAKRINEVAQPKILQAMVVDMSDNEDNDHDTVTVGITAQANDKLIDERTGKLIYQDSSEFTEYWQLARKDNTWILKGITQATEAKWKKDSELAKFASDNGFFYSLDYGWLLIPNSGQLFKTARFGTSDINNHIIGLYKEYLLQLYTYDPVPKSSGSYLIAQTNVPKSYGSIVVRRRHAFNFIKPKGLQQYSMEWQDFNKKYEVFASTAEGVTSFELLHPAFMEKLEALPFEINIEVADNIVYLYTQQSSNKAPADRYKQMLEILREAYKQMKL